MISGNLKIMDLFGIAVLPETALPEGISITPENAGQEFAGIFAEVVNAILPQNPIAQLPIVESFAVGEAEQSIEREPALDNALGAVITNNSQSPVSPKFILLENVKAINLLNQIKTPLPALSVSKNSLNNEPVDTFEQPLKNLDFANSLMFESAVELSDTKMPLITIDGKEVLKEVKIPEAPLSIRDNNLLARLNLKEINIITENSANAPIEVEHESRHRFTLGQMPKVEMSDAPITSNSPASKTEPNQNAEKNAPNTLVDGRDMTLNENQTEFDDNFNHSHARTQLELITHESEHLSGKIEKNDEPEIVSVNKPTLGQSKTEQNINVDSKIWTGKETDSQSGQPKTEPSVRVILPENAKQSSGYQKNSIMIKIEPAHLGPAQLDLHLKNEVLTARLTVETASAKSTLENSINTLKEQFVKADLKVEQIEINVRGETNYNQLFNRQPQWQKFNSAHQARFNADDLAEPFVPVNQIYNFRQDQYVGSTGVNVLA